MGRYVAQHQRKPSLRKQKQRRLATTGAFAISALLALSGNYGFVSGVGATPMGPSLAQAGNGETGAGGSSELAKYLPTGSAKQAVKPAFVQIDRIGTTSSLIPLGLHDDGTLQVPTVPSQAGWYAGGVVPGQVGPAIIVGHLDSYVAKTAIFGRLRELLPGDLIRVVLTDGSTKVFSITRVDQYPKNLFPTDLVYGPTTEPELRLITCAGTFDQSKHSYDDNTVVYATLTSST